MVTIFARRFFEFHHITMFLMWGCGGIYMGIKSIVIGYLAFLFARMVLSIQPFYSMVFAWVVSMGAIIWTIIEVVTS